MIHFILGIAMMGLNVSIAFEDDAGLHQYRPVNSTMPAVPSTDLKHIKKAPVQESDPSEVQDLLDRNYENLDIYSDLESNS